MVSDYRIEQLLDKIIDNALDFHRANTPIKVHLDTYRDFLQIMVANRGPTLPPQAERTLFDSMVSHRAAQTRLHFGLGLYVVRIIAEYHGGFARAVNLADGSGVAILVQLPLADPSGVPIQAPAGAAPALSLAAGSGSP
jgi:two-component system sensor histidine kinase ChvG